MIPFLVAGEPQRSPGQDTTSRSPDPWVSLQRGAEVEVRHPYAGSLQQTGPEGGNPTAEALKAITAPGTVGYWLLDNPQWDGLVKVVAAAGKLTRATHPEPGSGAQARRSVRCSPTRMALAMAVSAGLTAPILGKKLVSTT